MTGDTDHSVFDQLAGLLDYPMFIVTTRVDDELAGCLVGFATQVSLSPLRFLAGLSKNNHTFRVGVRATHLAVHVLPHDQLDTARLFGSETGDRVDKFEQCLWQSGPSGLPIISNSAAWFAGRIVDRFDLGDHVGFLLDPVAGQAPEQLPDLVMFSDVRELDPGHEA